MPKVVDKDAARAQIMDAALRIYAESGVHAASLEKVAAAAGIGKGTLYYYFKSKDALAIAIADRYFDALEVELAALSEVDTAEALFDVLAQVADRSDGDCQTVRVLIEVFSPGFGSGKALARARTFFDTASAALERTFVSMQNKGVLSARTDAAMLAQLLTALLDGIGLHSALMGIPAPRRTGMNAKLIEVLSRGLR